MMKKLLFPFIFGVLACAAHAQKITLPSFDGDFDTWLRNNATFPEIALADGLTGPVEIHALISREGRVQNIKITKYPHPAIRDEVSRIMKTARFIPAMKDGKPVFRSVDIMFDLTRLLDPQVAREMTVVETFEKPKWLTEENETTSFNAWLRGQYVIPPHLADTVFSKKISVTFIVNAEGFLENVTAEADDEPLRDEIQRVVRTSPQWQPALVNGQPHRFTMTQEVKLDGDENGKVVIYDFVDDMPKFLKNEDRNTNFSSWVSHRLENPDLNPGRETTRVTSRFVVEKDGSVSNIEILQSPDSVFSEEAIKVIKQSPKWYSPGTYMGEPVRVRVIIPFFFRP